MNLLITGGREFTDLELAFDTISHLNNLFPITYLIHGDARGADRLADKVADSLGIDRIKMPANWTKHKKGAGPKRNKSMLDLMTINLVLAFPGNNGTADMKRQATTRGIDVIEATELLDDFE